MKYEGPSPDWVYRDFKFIRVENDVHITQPDDIDTLHTTLAEQDGILGRVMRLIAENPEEVDAGLMTIITMNKRRLVQIYNRSGTLGLPKTSRACPRTLDVARKLSPGYEIEEGNG